MRAGCLALGVFVAVGVVVPGLLERFHVLRGGAPWLGVLTGAAASLVLELMPSAWQTVSHGGPGARLVTARTLTGLRTVDLDRLVRVRRFRVGSRGGWVDELGITDSFGVGFRFDDRDLAERVAAAVRRSRSTRSSRDASVPPVRVSRFAADRLGLTPALDRGERLDRGAADFLLSVLVPLSAGLLGALAVWLVASA